MKKFVKEILIFAVLTSVMLCCADYYLSYTGLQPNSWGWYEIYNDTTHYDLLINGNSRARYHYDTRIIDSVLHVNSFNLGTDGGPINRQMVRYRKMCQYHGHPKYLIQNLEYFTMTQRYPFGRHQFYPYFIYDESLISELKESEGFTWSELYIPFVRYWGAPSISSTTSVDHKGFVVPSGHWDGVALAAMKTSEAKKDPDMIREFGAYIEELKQQGTKIVFVLSPLYYEAQEKYEGRELVLAIYDSIAEKYDIPVLNYLESPINYDAAYFGDPTHLNARGADTFTRQLAHDLDSIGFIQHK